jgi:hypothetical protein
LPLLATLGVLLGILDGDVGWHRLAAAGDHFLAAWDRERFSFLLASGVLGDDAEQLLSGVPKNVVQWPKGRRWLRVTHAASGHLWS